MRRHEDNNLFDRLAVFPSSEIENSSLSSASSRGGSIQPCMLAGGHVAMLHTSTKIRRASLILLGVILHSALALELIRSPFICLQI